MASREVFRFCEKPIHGTFLVFCKALQQHEGLKWTQMVLWGKSLTVGFFGQKVAQNEFFVFYNKSMH